MKHAVTVEIVLSDSVPHHEVQSRVLRAVSEFFPERDGVLSVAGFDRAKLEKQHDEVLSERNALADELSRILRENGGGGR